MKDEIANIREILASEFAPAAVFRASDIRVLLDYIVELERQRDFYKHQSADLLNKLADTL